MRAWSAYPHINNSYVFKTSNRDFRGLKPERIFCENLQLLIMLDYSRIRGIYLDVPKLKVTLQFSAVNEILLDRN